MQAVELAFAPTLPGSPLFNEVPLDGQILHLPLEDTPDANGNVRFKNISGSNYVGICSGDTCPQTGATGARGNPAQFDGDQKIDVALNAPDSNFSLATWVKLDNADTNNLQHTQKDKENASAEKTGTEA